MSDEAKKEPIVQAAEVIADAIRGVDIEIREGLEGIAKAIRDAAAERNADLVSLDP